MTRFAASILVSVLLVGARPSSAVAQGIGTLPSEEPAYPSEPQPTAPAQPGPTPAAYSPAVAQPSPFDQHRIRLGLGAGGGSYNGHGYFAIEAGAGYYILPGLELGFDVTQWFGSEPNQTQLSPHLRYIFYQLLRSLPAAPYLGAFYRHWFIWEGFSDFDTIGGRAGVVVRFGRRTFLSFGGAYERVLNSCENGCNAYYPELTFAFVL